ncbi:MAG: 16S rRNA (cytosine(967)-C(5))-methyltransferase RsmB [Clostridiales bacterium]|nr:16S rRNA (cytosine(967)-C(5))-methyltransferase RsmB [Clostridiales bacterium]
MTAREVALLTLGACERRGAWSDGLLKKSIREGGLDRRDAALATKLCLGVLQNKILLDFYLSQYSTMKLEKMELKVRNALRLGIYQMAFLTRVPHSAAVNESVALVRRHCKNPRAAGMVNGILRTVSRNIDRLPVLDARDPVLYLSLRYSHPEWLVRAHCAELGLEETEGLLQWNNSDSPTVAQVNTCKTDVEALTAALLEEGVQAEQHTWLENTLILSDTGDLEELSAFQEGAFYVQGAAARLVVTAAGLQPGMHVLDACAAPGGKSFAAAMDMEDKGEILACDIHSHKKKLIEAGALRLGLQSIKALILDGKKRDEALEERFDAVITDVPCSGLGVIRKKPEIRYKSPEDLEGLPEVQGAILDNVSAYVKPGGVLLYATCTLLRRENEDVVAAFLKGHPEFTLEPFDLPEPVGACREGLITLWPQRHATDGFFIAKLRKA